MSDLATWLSGVRDRLSKSTPGPWLTDDAVRFIVVENEENDTDLIALAEMCSTVDQGANAALIASSPTDLALAVEIIAIQADALDKINYIEKNVWVKMALAKIDALLKGSGE